MGALVRPCRMVGPILERPAVQFAGHLKVVKANVDEARFEARLIPMMLVMRTGDAVETVIGAQPEHVMRTLIERHLAASA